MLELSGFGLREPSMLEAVVGGGLIGGGMLESACQMFPGHGEASEVR